jgi:hypothetical protein
MGGRLSGLHMRPQNESDWVGKLRDLRPIITEIGKAADQVFNFVKGGEDVLQKLADAYQLPGGPGDGDGNATDLVGERIPRADSERKQPQVGGGFKNLGLKLRLIDLKILPSPSTLTLSGEAKATLELATDYPAAFDSPTDIDLKVTSTSISASQIGVTGSATMDKVLHADLTLQLHYDPRQLFETVVRFAKKRNLTRGEVGQLLGSMSLDARAIMKLGPVPISIMNLSASSVLPMRRPLIGATDELLPVQLSSLPNRTVSILGVQAVPKGVFFDVPVPALGAHYSNYGYTRGFSATAAALAKPDLDHIGQFQAFGFVDLHYAKRVSNTVDLNFGATYTYSPAGATPPNEALQVQYLHARSKSWLGPSRDNEVPGADRSGHNFMFNIRGTFDLL